MRPEDCEKIVSETLSWIGTPFRHRARVKGQGVDCAMFLAEVYEKTGMIPKVDVPHYSPDHMKHRNKELLLGVVLKYFDLTEEPVSGGIALWQFGRNISHDAIVIDWPTCIHTPSSGRVCRFDAEREIEKSRFRGFYVPKER